MPGSEPGVGEDKTQRPRPATRSMFRHFSPLQTRWSDNDSYGHINNVVYYAYFDTVVNDYLISRGALDVAHGAVIGLVVETQCNYFRPIAFPDKVDGYLVSHLEVGIFKIVI